MFQRHGSRAEARDAAGVGAPPPRDGAIRERERPEVETEGEVFLDPQGSIRGNVQGDRVGREMVDHPLGRSMPDRGLGSEEDECTNRQEENASPPDSVRIQRASRREQPSSCRSESKARTPTVPLSRTEAK